MQVMPETFQEMGGTDPNDSTQNIYAGAKYLSQQLDKYKDVSTALAAYNAGPGAVDKHGGIPPFPETQGYVKNITAAYGGKGAPADDGTGMALAQQLAGKSSPAPAAPADDGTGLDFAQGLITSGKGNIPSASKPAGGVLPGTDISAPMSKAGSVLQGMRDPIDGATELLDKSLPAGMVDAVSRGANKLAKMVMPDYYADSLFSGKPIAKLQSDNEAAYQASRAAATPNDLTGLTGGQKPAPGFDGYRLLGNIASPANLAIAARAPTALTLAGRMGVGAATGAAASALMPVNDPGDYWDQKAKQVATGVVLGGVLPAAGAGLNKLTNALAGGGVSPEIALLAKRANDLGVPVSGPQITNSKTMQTLASVTDQMPFSGAAARSATQGQAFTRAVAKTFGEDATNLTPEVMAGAKSRIGSVFNDVLSRNSIKADDSMMGSLASIETNAQAGLQQSQADTVSKLINGAMSKFKGDNLEGNAYQNFRTNVLLPATKSDDTGIKHAAGQILETMDGALNRSVSGADAKAITTARSQWRNMRTIEDLAEKAPTGDISPALLLGQVRKGTSDMAYGGGGDLADLARIGQQFIKQKIPDSGTSIRRATMGSLSLAGGAAMMGNFGPAIGGTAGLAIGKAANMSLNSNAYKNLLLRSIQDGNVGGAGQPIPNSLIERLAPYLIQAGKTGASSGTAALFGSGPTK